jgi:ENTS family enterobactin (siderophore) exporter
VPDRRLGPIRLLQGATNFRLLVLATFGSGLGTYLAVLALTVHVYDVTGSPTWVGALLIVDFLPMIAIGLALGPLVDRLSRRRLMIEADLLRLAVFCALPFVDRPELIVVLAGVAGVATGFFRPAAHAALPNLVSPEDLPTANSLLQTVENLAWLIGPVAGGALVASFGTDLAYWINALTFLVSALILLGIAESALRGGDMMSRGHWRDVGDGLALVRRSRPLSMVLVVWSVAIVGNAFFNVSEVFFAKDVLDSGDLGFGILVGATGLGLTVGGFFGGRWIDRFGVTRVYVASLALWGAGVAAAALSPWLALAAGLVAVGLVGNGAAVVCNLLLVQRGAPDQLRGRAFTVIMSVNYLLLGLGMAAAGPLTDAIGARWMWGAAAGTYGLATLLALVLARGVVLAPADGRAEPSPASSI